MNAPSDPKGFSKNRVATPSAIGYGGLKIIMEVSYEV
jgi:hypothetical protein